MSSKSSEADESELTVRLPNLDVRVRRTGEGEPILLLHGFPHTKEIWELVTPLLVKAGHQVVAPDLRGIGSTDRTDSGYDAATLALDHVHLIDAFDFDRVHVVGFDVGAAAAFALATNHQDRIKSLTIVEAVIGGLAGAEVFLEDGVPWWFGFHQTAGLAENVLVGNEDQYVRYFLRTGSRIGVPEHLAKRFAEAYTGRDRLRAAFQHYRAMPGNAAANAAWAERGRLSIPVTAVGASTVRGALASQLTRVAADLHQQLLLEAGHIVPIDAPAELAEIIISTATRGVKGFA